MNYMKPLAYVGGAVVAVSVLVWLQRSLAASGGEKTRGVTATATAGQAQEKPKIVSPINSNNVAFVAVSSTVDLILNSAQRLAGFIPSKVFPLSNDRLKPNPASAEAAYTSPIRPQYKPSSYATF